MATVDSAFNQIIRLNIDGNREQEGDRNDLSKFQDRTYVMLTEYEYLEVCILQKAKG